LLFLFDFPHYVSTYRPADIYNIYNNN